MRVEGALAFLHVILTSGVDPPAIHLPATLLGESAMRLAAPGRLGTTVRLYLMVHLADATVLMRLPHLTMGLRMGLGFSESLGLAGTLDLAGMPALDLAELAMRLRHCAAAHSTRRAVHRRAPALHRTAALHRAPARAASRSTAPVHRAARAAAAMPAVILGHRASRSGDQSNRSDCNEKFVRAHLHLLGFPPPLSASQRRPRPRSSGALADVSFAEPAFKLEPPASRRHLRRTRLPRSRARPAVARSARRGRSCRRANSLW